MRQFPATPSIRGSITAGEMKKAADAFTQSLPQWIKGASAANIYKLRVLIANHRASQVAVADATKAVAPLKVFAESMYSEALASMLPSGQTLTTLQWRRKIREEVGQSTPHIQESWEVQPALPRLMQNFAAGVTPLSGSGLVIQRDDEEVIGHTAQLIEACRELDAGKQYQTLLERHFTQNKALLSTDKLAGFKLAVHVAFLKRKIDSDVKAALEYYVEGASATGTEHRLTAYPGLMSILGVRVHEALIIQLQTADGDNAGVVTYMPADARNPLRWHSSTHDLQKEMVTDLMQEHYLHELLQLIALDDRNAFFRQLQLRLSDALPDLEIEGDTGHGSVFARWVDTQVERVRADAKVLLVPTTDADAKASRQRLEDWKSLGWEMAGLAAFFIPAVGVVLLGTLLKDVCTQVFEGVADWAKGHDHEALQHALNVAQIAAATAVGVGIGAAVGLAVDKVLADGLETVALDDDTQGLWNGDLSLYESGLPDDATLGEDGLYSSGNRRWLKAGEHHYEVHQPSENGARRLVHPDRPQAYGPVLQRNAERLWLLPDDSPMDWNDAQQMLARLWPQEPPLDQQRAQQVLQASCSDVDELRGTLVDNRPLPANVRETLRRFEADERIERFFSTVAAGATEVDDQALLEWCKTRPGLAEMESAERSAAILEQQSELRHDLFDFLTSVESGTDPVVRVLKRDFAGLPNDYASDLASQVSADQREEIVLLERLPLPVATKARSLLQLARLNHAVQGVMLRNAYSDESGELALGLLSRLDHWSFNKRVELRFGSAEGRLLAVLNSQEPEAGRVILARKESAFVLYDTNGLECPEQSSVPDDFFQAIVTLLTSEEKAALSLGSHDQAGELRRQVVNLLPAGRQKLVRQLGWQEQQGWFNPGQRLKDGRVGYPLGGSVSNERGPGWRVRRRLSRLYRGDTPRQIDEHLNRILDAANPYAALIQEEQNYYLLDSRLATWIADGARAERAARRMLAQRLQAAWRRQLPIDVQENTVRGFVLDLGSHSVSSLPELDAAIDFHHVTSLTMVNTDLQAIPDSFFSCFGHLRRLNMSRNRLEALPLGIRHLRFLERLALSYNRIRSRESAVAALSPLTRLEDLDLSFNPAIRRLSVANWASSLRRLSLRQCGLLEWPAGLEQCRLLYRIDLRSNYLRDVPAAIREMPYTFRASILLDRSAVEAAELDRLYARPAPVHRPAPQPAPPELAARALWVNGEEAEARGARWDRLFDGQSNEELKEILRRLQDSSDYQVHRTELTTRVWTLLDAMDTSETLADDVRNYAGAEVTCGDDVIDLFSELYLLALANNTMRAAAEGKQQQALLDLGQGLFRLNRLKEYIGTFINAHPNLDAVEVSLYFRLQLADEMRLPGQPSSMLYENLVKREITKNALDAARSFVADAETVEAKAAFLSQQKFWREWLEKQHADEFATILEQSHEKQAALDDRMSEMTSQEYKDQSDLMLKELEEMKNRLVILLTTPMLEADADPVLPPADQTGHPD
ncbi:NEL-type E3 ubiquitin ligase domain-containing protein [Pseudomonas putida]|uniref:NEL-type E3 ubiquitin ligase domain-containing protein n=1 Tax=Pseudomonas putida TaxID=303 RepID=UPI0013747616|nr:NEL-type E3 ubiquitin ligase domain-containing protein [Pseudomonas putida]